MHLAPHFMTVAAPADLRSVTHSSSNSSLPSLEQSTISLGLDLFLIIGVSVGDANFGRSYGSCGLGRLADSYLRLKAVSNGTEFYLNVGSPTPVSSYCWNEYRQLSDAVFQFKTSFKNDDDIFTSLQDY